MTTKQVASLVSEAIGLDNEIARLELILDCKKTQLTDLARLTLRTEAGVKDATGSSQTFTGELPTEICRVNFPGPKLIGGIWFFKTRGQPEKALRKSEGKTIEAGPLKELAGEHWDKLFFGTWKPAKAFRDLVPVLLEKTPAKARELIELCQEPSSPRVCFETKALTHG